MFSTAFSIYNYGRSFLVAKMYYLPMNSTLFQVASMIDGFFGTHCLIDFLREMLDIAAATTTKITNNFTIVSLQKILKVKNGKL